MTTIWDELQKELHPIQDYDDLRRRWHVAFSYPFVCEVYNFTIPEIADYTRRLLAEDRRNRYAEYAQKLVETFQLLGQAGVQDLRDLLTQVDTRAQFETFTAQTQIPARALIAVLKYLSYWVIPMQKLLSSLISDNAEVKEAVNALRSLGVRSNLDLLQQGRTPAGRQALAEASGVPEALIAELVNRADFSRMPWASKATISNFIGAGYGSLADLANAKSDQLYEDFFRYGASIGKNLKMGNEIENSHLIAKIVPTVLTDD